LPAKDYYHDTVVRALTKAGWMVTKEQVTIVLDKRRLWIDIRAVKESESLMILVEVKGFQNMPSPMNYLADAVGKYVVYRSTLDYLRFETPLYMAVPLAAYESILSETIAQPVFQRANIKLIVFDPKTEEIVQWID
jgi:hypothetical protein